MAFTDKQLTCVDCGANSPSPQKTRSSASPRLLKRAEALPGLPEGPQGHPRRRGRWVRRGGGGGGGYSWGRGRCSRLSARVAARRRKCRSSRARPCRLISATAFSSVRRTAEAAAAALAAAAVVAAASAVVVVAGEAVATEPRAGQSNSEEKEPRGVRLFVRAAVFQILRMIGNIEPFARPTSDDERGHTAVPLLGASHSDNYRAGCAAVAPTSVCPFVARLPLMPAAACCSYVMR